MKKIIEATDTLKELFSYYIGMILICSLAFSFAENKSLLDSIWWAFVTASTTGYGDIYPITTTGRLIAIFLMHCVYFFILPLILGRMLNTLIQNKNEFSDSEQEDMKAQLDRIEEKLNNINRNNQPKLWTILTTTNSKT